MIGVQGSVEMLHAQALVCPPPIPDLQVPCVHHPELQPGELYVDGGGAGAVVPDPGTFVFSESLVENGSAQSLFIGTTVDGQVWVIGDGPEGEFDPEPPEAPDECSDPYYAPGWWYWPVGTTHKYYIHRATTPGYLSESTTTEAIRQGVRNITQMTNNCGLADAIQFSAGYLGDRATYSDVSLAGDCATSDQVSETDFYSISDPGQVKVAVACVYGDFGELFPSDNVWNGDIRFDSGKTWFNLTCPVGGAYKVEAVTTHEKGHFFGLLDVHSGAHAALSMYGTMKRCPTAGSWAETLAIGDIYGFKAKGG